MSSVMVIKGCDPFSLRVGNAVGLTSYLVPSGDVPVPRTAAYIVRRTKRDATNL